MCAVDGSDGSKKALHFAQKYASRLEATLKVLNVARTGTFDLLAQRERVCEFASEVCKVLQLKQPYHLFTLV